MQKPAWFLSSMALILVFSLMVFSRVEAQTVTPQKVIAVYDGDLSWLFWDCVNIPFKVTAEVWNVGAAGGAQYADAVIKWEGNHCNVDSHNVATPGGWYSYTIPGTFSGGPDGTLDFSMATLGFQGESKILFAGGTSAKLIITFKDRTATLDLVVQNPEAFGELSLPTAEPTPGSFCQPVISNITGLKPGDTLSPAVEYVDENGKNVGALSSVWYINGAQTNSVTWDGAETQLILQYTCPDHSAHEKRVTIPAYDGSKTSSQPDTDKILKTGVIGGGLLAAAAGAAAAATAGGVAAAQLLRPPAPAPGTVRPAPRQPVPPVNTPPASARQSPAPQPPPRPVESPPRQSPPVEKPLSFDERISLENRRAQIESVVLELTNKFNALGAEREILLEYFRSNTLKFVIKNAIRSAGKIVTSVPEAVTGPILDPVMDAVFGMHDTSNDPKIILRIHAEIQQKRAQMRDLYRQTMDLRREIGRINQRLAGK